MNEQTKKALTNAETWLRLPVMALFFVMLLIATPLLIALALYAWILRLFRAEFPPTVVRFGKDLGAWFERSARYLTGAADRRPFPFEDLDCPRDPVPAARAAPASRPPTAIGSADEAGAQSPVVDAEPDQVSAKGVASAAKQAKADSQTDGAGTARTSKKKSASGKKKAPGKSAKKKSASKKKAGKKSASKKAAKKKSSAVKQDKPVDGGKPDDKGTGQA